MGKDLLLRISPTARLGGPVAGGTILLPAAGAAVGMWPL
jgi:hypothetical protein